jgi:hypothetical protein
MTLKLVHIVRRVTIDGALDRKLRLLAPFTTRNVTARNYSAIADLRTLKMNTARATSFQSAVSSQVVPC